MATAVRTSLWTERIPDQPYRMRFVAHYSAVNWGDAEISVRFPQALLRNGTTKTVFIERIAVHIASAAAVKVTQANLRTPAGAGETWGYLWLDAFTTVGTYGNHLYEIYAPTAILDTTTDWVDLKTEDNAAGDDAYIAIWGYFEYAEVETIDYGEERTATPVSVEGYKWPLTRRL